MSVEIRVLGRDEAAVLDHVEPEVFDAACVPALLEEFFRDPRHHLVVALDSGRVVGFASGVHYVHPDKPAEMFINEVGVAPTHQGRGIGKGIMQAMLEHATRLGCEQAWVLTDRSNVAAMGLYAAAGGEASGDHVMFTFVLKRN